MTAPDAGPGEALRGYHERTKHSPRSVRESVHFLDWDNEPSRFKEYAGLGISPLPPFRPSGVPCHQAVRASARPEDGASLDLETLSYLLFHAAGVSRTVPSPYGEFHFRTYASAGALYPVEAYVVAGEIEGLEAGVYHYAPREHGLVRLRAGDFRGSLGLAGAAPGASAVVLGGIPWRTAWKYGTRGFRHLYWDAGMMLANLLAAAAARGLGARVHLGFVDGSVNGLLGLDGLTEFALCVIPLGEGDSPPAVEVSPLSLETAAPSARPERDPIIEEAHMATELRTEDAVRRFRNSAVGREKPPDLEGVVHAVSRLHLGSLSADPIEAVIRRRGSSRGLAREAHPAAEHAAILDGALAGVPGDWVAEGTAVEPMLIDTSLEGIPPGVHDYVPGGTFLPVREGTFRGEAGYLCLEQRLGADAAAVTFLLADLDRYLGGLGDRGYVAAQLEAAIAAGRIYLGAYAQCLGASGITFYDDDVRRFLGTASEPMLVMVAGPEARRRSIRRCRERRRPDVPPVPGGQPG